MKMTEPENKNECPECGAYVLNEETHKLYHNAIYDILRDIHKTIKSLAEAVRRIKNAVY